MNMMKKKNPDFTILNVCESFCTNKTKCESSNYSVVKQNFPQCLSPEVRFCKHFFVRIYQNASN